jgi:hypothetical protein
MTDINKQELETQLIESFKQDFYEKLGYYPVVNKYIAQTPLSSPITLEELERCFDPFLPNKFGKKLYLSSSTRYREIVDLRAIFSYIARSMQFSLSSIGEYLGGRHHTTIIHCMEIFDHQISTSDQFRLLYNAILNTIKRQLKNKYESKPSVMVYIDQIFN